MRAVIRKSGKDITGDALLTQRSLATYVVERKAHYHFTVKGNQPALQRDIALLFKTRVAPDFVEVTPPDHGRIETRSTWCGTVLNASLDFPHVGQVFMIERESINKKTGVPRREIALGITSRTPQEASPKRVLAVNRGHWSIESVQYIIDWNYDEDRSRIRTGFGPENITRPAPLCGGHSQVISETRSIHRRNDAQTHVQNPSRLRLFANDSKFESPGIRALRTNLPCQ